MKSCGSAHSQNWDVASPLPGLAWAWRPAFPLQPSCYRTDNCRVQCSRFHSGPFGGSRVACSVDSF